MLRSTLSDLGECPASVDRAVRHAYPGIVHLVITDLDGTLLDRSTYAYDDALPALELLRRRKIPVVFCTSKTCAETEMWREVLRNRDPFIVENGGAVFVPSGYFPVPARCTVRRGDYDVLELGAPYPELTGALRLASSRSGCRVRGFGDMSVDQIASACQMSVDAARLARQREYDEPFLILNADRTGQLLDAIRTTGKRWTRGGRFYHIVGDSDKGAAARLVVERFKTIDPEVRVVGLGDGLNDASFLNLADIPFLVRSPSLEQLRSAVPNGIATEQPGPKGWNEAILSVFGG